MFKNVEYSDIVPPNFIQSILTNPSLYSMFKDDFEANREYFQSIDREVYLSQMLEFVCDTLFSSNLFHIYSKPEDLDEYTKGKLFFIKNFYDDFLLESFKEDPTRLLKIRLFRGLEYAHEHDEYAKNSKEFTSLYDYIFKESLDYDGIVEVLIKEPLATLKKREPLSLKDFDILCNYVKNNTRGYVDIEIVKCMLHNHAYKKNHIFDADVARTIAASLVHSYLSTYGIEVDVSFVYALESGNLSEHDIEAHIIKIDNSLIEAFCSLNYVELFEHLFKEADSLRNAILLERNEENMATLSVLMNLISLGMDLDKLFQDSDYTKTEYTDDLEASSFIKTLRFFSSFGVNLFDNFIESISKKYELEIDINKPCYSKKEISLDQRFNLAFASMPNKKFLISKYKVLKALYMTNGTKKNTIDIIKSIPTATNPEFLIEYLHSRIIEPESMIKDVIDLYQYKPRNDNQKRLIEQELKYIYVDTFSYSLDSYLKLNGKLDREEYLSDLLIKINCIPDTPITHRFLDEAKDAINLYKTDIS